MVSASSSNVVPEASLSPRWLQALHYTMRPLDYLSQAAERSGDMFNAPVIGHHKNVLMISHPQGIQQLFASDKCITAPPNGLLQPIVGDRSIFGLEGQRHRRERKLLMPPFHRDKIPQYGHLIQDLTHGAMAQIKPGQPFLARSLMQSISLDIILKVVFGISDSDRFDLLKSLMVKFTDCLQNTLIAGALFFPALQQDWAPWGQFQRVKAQISEVLFAEIGDRRTQDIEAKNDILSLLLTTRDENGDAMTDAELHDELLTMLVAGHETTASAISWALYWVYQNPRVHQILTEELTPLGHTPDPVAVTQLPYLSAVCNETLRLYPIAVLTVPREVLAPMTLMGYSLEPGTRLYGAIYLTHHRADLYPESHCFRPERFLERQFTNYEFLPFGGGMRRCIGDILAQFEMKLVLATLVVDYGLKWVGKTPEVPKRRGVTMAPGNGVELVRVQ